MRTQYYTAASLDGFIATVDDSLAWLFPLGDVNATSYPQFIKSVGALAMGSATYEWLWRHVSKPEAASPGEWPYHQPTWVFSRRALPGIPSADIRFVQGDVRPVHAQMRAAAHGRNLWLVGGGELVGQFYDAGLLDDLIVQVASVTLGAGKLLLPRQITSPSLKLVSVQQFGAGFAELRYEVPARGAAGGRHSEDRRNG
jgi:dihydrofolate reductase